MEGALATFRQDLVTAPQPVALTLGRVCRFHDDKELIEATLKAAEVLARYLAALAISSFCAREDAASEVPKELLDFRENLSFGHFISVLKGIARSSAIHPLGPYLTMAFGSINDNSTDDAKSDEEPKVKEGERVFNRLVELRNELGHKLSTITAAKAKQILEKNQPVQCLREALNSCQRLLDLPLFLLEEQRLVKGIICGRRLLLMGDGEPSPDMIELEAGLQEDNQLYVGLKTGALLLPPFLLWDIVQARASYGLYLLHRAEPKKLKYLTVHDDELISTNNAAEFEVLTLGSLRPIEQITLKEKGNLFSEWLTLKRVREKTAQLHFGAFPWEQLKESTLRWYEGLLGNGPKAEQKQKRPGSLIIKTLLDGRDVLSTDEIQQLVLLFGKDIAVSRLAKRPLVDCRARKRDSEQRWQERKESTENLLESLRVAIDFFSRHIGVQGVTIDGLKATAGSADYIAMREALVNLFIHQDYTNAAVAGQIEIRDDRTIFHNAGSSLVSAAGLVDGGKSTARNPIISRALRLIGFAELAGSGLLAVHAAWRKARRRPPKIESNSEANTFTLTLDWRPLEKEIDSFWMKKLGVKLSPEQAGILSLLVTPEPFSLEQIASASGLYLSDAKAATDYLKLQALIVEDQGRFALRSDLAELAANRK